MNYRIWTNCTGDNFVIVYAQSETSACNLMDKHGYLWECEGCGDLAHHERTSAGVFSTLGEAEDYVRSQGARVYNYVDSHKEELGIWLV